ncbi:MAG: FtsQ-type POTRA domain-containing protein [Deltaproteobacteria bacterium]|nr:FtsQ-type POTRA domain-containing protein [Deltaproteobacteria bacterium]
MMACRRKTINIRRKEPVINRAGRVVKSNAVVKTLKVGIGIMSLLLIIWGVWHTYNGLLTTPYLSIKEIKVIGSGKLSKSDILELSGINVGDNLIAINSTDIKNSIKTNPWVATVNIARRFPDKLTVEIKERKPVAFINLDGLYLIDDAGIIFKRASVADDIDLPVITGLRREDIEEQGTSSDFAVKAVNLLHLLTKRGIVELEDISEINVDRIYGLTLYAMEEGTKIEFGSEGFEEKLDSFEKVIKSRNGLAGLEFIGLNYSRGVVVKPRLHNTPATHKVEVKVQTKKAQSPTST